MEKIRSPARRIWRPLNQIPAPGPIWFMSGKSQSFLRKKQPSFRLLKRVFTLTACQAGATCTQPPRFRITGMEPLPGYTIKEIHTRISMRHNICKNVDKCEMELPQSTRNGALLEYWRVSSYGDESEHKTVRYRNVYDSQGTGTYYLDVLDPEINTNFASQQWKVFPSLEPDRFIFFIPAWMQWTG